MVGVDKHVGATEPENEIVMADENRGVSYVNTDKSFWNRIWPVIACGAGLFSDGYLNGVIGSVSTMLSTIYPDAYKGSPAEANVTAITFAGTVVGMLFFGWTSDHVSRKWSLFVSTIIVLLFAALGAGSYGAGGSPLGLFAALTAYRFFLGIGIGGEYPAGSVACAESTGELKEGTRNRWFILFTNCQIDFGFVVAAIVPMIVVCLIAVRSQSNCILNTVVTGPYHRRKPPPRSLAYLPRTRSHPTAFAALPSIEAHRARVLQAQHHGQDKDTVEAGHQVLLVPFGDRCLDLVHLRL